MKLSKRLLGVFDNIDQSDMIKTGDAFVAFIDWDLSGWLRKDQVTADDMYSCVRDLNELVEAQSRPSRPERIDWVMDAHRIVWFKKPEMNRELAIKILAFFNKLSIEVQSHRARSHERGLPSVFFKAGIGTGKVNIHQTDRNVLFGEGVNDAIACSKEARGNASFIVASAQVLDSIRSNATQSLLISDEIRDEKNVSLDEQQLANLVRRLQ
jgi:hypothetical protein